MSNSLQDKIVIEEIGLEWHGGMICLYDWIEWLAEFNWKSRQGALEHTSTIAKPYQWAMTDNKAYKTINNTQFGMFPIETGKNIQLEKVM